MSPKTSVSGFLLFILTLNYTEFINLFAKLLYAPLQRINEWFFNVIWGNKIISRLHIFLQNIEIGSVTILMFDFIWLEICYLTNWKFFRYSNLNGENSWFRTKKKSIINWGETNQNYVIKNNCLEKSKILKLPL